MPSTRRESFAFAIRTLMLAFLGAAIVFVGAAPLLRATPVASHSFSEATAAEETAWSQSLPVNKPVWNAEYAAQFPNYSGVRHGLPESVIAVDLSGEAHRYPTAVAWERVERGDFWVIGFAR